MINCSQFDRGDQTSVEGGKSSSYKLFFLQIYSIQISNVMYKEKSKLQKKAGGHF